ncbi:hypothetical protein K438DRAFT_1926871 [Mycena galopus ATCC 62051]|nr:hypothetical protein K438DRAFT_1926871 [Mycena galopus ATCC 62051]
MPCRSVRKQVADRSRWAFGWSLGVMYAGRRSHRWAVISAVRGGSLTTPPRWLAQHGGDTIATARSTGGHQRCAGHRTCSVLACNAPPRAGWGSVGVGRSKGEGEGDTICTRVSRHMRHASLGTVGAARARATASSCWSVGAAQRDDSAPCESTCEVPCSSRPSPTLYSSTQMDRRWAVRLGPARRHRVLHREHVGGAHLSGVVPVARGRWCTRMSDVAPRKCVLPQKTASNPKVGIPKIRATCGTHKEPRNTRLPGHPMHEIVEYHHSTQNHDISSPTSAVESNGTWRTYRIGLSKCADDEETDWWMSWGSASQEMTPGCLFSKKTWGGEKAGLKQLDIPSVQQKREQEFVEGSGLKDGRSRGERQESRLSHWVTMPKDRDRPQNLYN